MIALIDAGERHDLPLDELGVYMRSMRVDCGPVRIGSDDELDVYMDGSAGSVGRIMAPLLGVPERFHADFGHLGQAFQLANFIRDVDEDWEMDRIYLPGLDDDDLGDRARATPRLRAVVGQQVARARALFAAAEPAVAAAPGLGALRHPAGLRRLRADPRPRRGGRRRRARPPRRRPRARPPAAAAVRR